jgi:hypothetical protein
MYFGASVPYHRSILAWEQELGSVLSVNRSYFGTEPDQAAKLVECCSTDLNQGRLPHVSIKPARAWHDVAAGADDGWLIKLLQQLGDGGLSAILTIHHEPENDAGGPGMLSADYVAMQERAIRLAADLAPRVIVAPILQHWTFEPLRDDIDPSAWIVPSASVFGIDVYNPWSPTNGKQWRSLGSKLDEIAGWTGGRPLVIGEYGCRDDPENPGLAAHWLRDAVDYALTHDVISMCYYNSGSDEPEGSWELTQGMQSTFAALLASDWVARPS